MRIFFVCILCMIAGYMCGYDFGGGFDSKPKK